MLNLFKTDLKRVLTSKGFIVTLIVSAIVAVLIAVGLYALYMFMISASSDDVKQNTDMRTLSYGLELMLQNMGIASGIVGLITPIVVINALASEFKFGTIRNKIINGYTRTQIYFSTLLVMIISTLIVFVAYQALLLGASSIFFNIAPSNADGAYYGSFFTSFGLIILYYVFIDSFLVLLLFANRRAVLPILMFVIGTSIFSLLGTACVGIETIFAGLKDYTGQEFYGGFAHLFRILANINPFYMMGVPVSTSIEIDSVSISSLIGTGMHKYVAEELYYILICTPLYIIFNIAIGCRVANKIDIK